MSAPLITPTLVRSVPPARMIAGRMPTPPTPQSRCSPAAFPGSAAPSGGSPSWSVVAVILTGIAAHVEHHAEHVRLLGKVVLALVDFVEPALLGRSDEQHTVEMRQERHHV